MIRKTRFGLKGPDFSEQLFHGEQCIARDSVQVNARHIVNAGHAGACYDFLMKDGWFQRLKRTIQADGRSLSQLAADAGLGRNYVQQMLKYDKEPGTDKLGKLLDALGSEDALYILTGLRVDEWDVQFLDAASKMTPKAKADLLRLARTLSEQQGQPATADDH